MPGRAELSSYTTSLVAREWRRKKSVVITIQATAAGVAISRPPASTLQFYPIYNLDLGHKKTITNNVIVGREGGNNISFGSKISWRENWARKIY